MVQPYYNFDESSIDPSRFIYLKTEMMQIKAFYDSGADISLCNTIVLDKHPSLNGCVKRSPITYKVQTAGKDILYLKKFIPVKLQGRSIRKKNITIRFFLVKTIPYDWIISYTEAKQLGFKLTQEPLEGSTKMVSYEPQRLEFGSKNAPAYSQAYKTRNPFVYLDDSIIQSGTEEENANNIEQFLEACGQNKENQRIDQTNTINKEVNMGARMAVKKWRGYPIATSPHLTRDLKDPQRQIPIHGSASKDAVDQWRPPLSETIFTTTHVRRDDDAVAASNKQQGTINIVPANKVIIRGNECQNEEMTIMMASKERRLLPINGDDWVISNPAVDSQKVAQGTYSRVYKDIHCRRTAYI
jgi:hypothetical protein